MKAKEIEAGWWWRHETDVSVFDGKLRSGPKAGQEGPSTTKPKPGSAGWYWQQIERAALGWELVRRLHSKKKLPAYPDLTADEKGLVNTALSVREPNTACVCTPPRDRAGDEWSEKLPHHWNLAVSDHALSETFLQLIAEQRAKYGLPTPRGMAGRKTRPAAWSWPEIWDRVENGHVAGSSERSMLKNARRSAREASKKLIQEIAETQNGLSLWRNIPSLLLLNSKRVERPRDHAVNVVTCKTQLPKQKQTQGSSPIPNGCAASASLT